MLLKAEAASTNTDKVSKADATKPKAAGDGDKSEAPSRQQQRQGVLSVLPQVIISVLFGLAAYHLPRHSVPMAGVFMTSPSIGLTMGALAIQIVACLYPVIAARQKAKATAKRLGEDAKTPDNNVSPDYRLHKCLALLAFGVATFAVSIVNISLGLFVAVVWTLPLLAIRPASSFVASAVQRVVLLLISPLSLLLVACVVYSAATAEVNAPYAVLRLSWEKFNVALFRSVVEDYVYGNWTYSVCTLVYFPLWLQFWSLLWNSPAVN